MVGKGVEKAQGGSDINMASFWKASYYIEVMKQGGSCSSAVKLQMVGGGGREEGSRGQVG